MAAAPVYPVAQSGEPDTAATNIKTHPLSGCKQKPEHPCGRAMAAELTFTRRDRVPSRSCSPDARIPGWLLRGAASTPVRNGQNDPDLVRNSASNALLSVAFR